MAIRLKFAGSMFVASAVLGGALMTASAPASALIALSCPKLGASSLAGMSRYQKALESQGLIPRGMSSRAFGQSAAFGKYMGSVCGNTRLSARYGR